MKLVESKYDDEERMKMERYKIERGGKIAVMAAKMTTFEHLYYEELEEKDGEKEVI